MSKTFVFDLDGTLLNTLPTIRYFCNETVARYGYPPVNDEQCKHMVGHGIGMLIEQLLKKYDCTDKKIYEEALAYYRKAYDDNAMYLTEPYNGICELVEKLKSEGHRLAVLSNKPDLTVNILIKHFFKDSFEIIYGARSDMPKKPDPTVLFDILKQLGADAKDCIYVGDSDVDMQTGKNAKVYTIGVSWGFRSVEELTSNGADMIAECADDIYNVMKNNE